MDYWRLVFDDLSSINHHYQIINLLENSFAPNANINNINHLDIIAYGYKQAKQYKKSVYWAEMVSKNCSIDQKRGARLNLGKMYIACNEPEKAESILDLNIKEDPQDIDSLVEYSISLFMQNKKIESYKLLQDAEENIKNKYDDISIKNKKILEFNKGAQ
jgi:tetratricopeptide (TPR) repeat protein